jgi:hypothetical protein
MPVAYYLQYLTKFVSGSSQFLYHKRHSQVIQR